MANTKSAMRGVSVVLQNAATTGNGQVLAIPSSFKKHTLIIKGSAGVASGAVQPEGSDDALYSGTWAQIGGGPVTVVASTEIIINFEGVFNFIRCGISSNIVGGTVTVTYLGS